ARVMPHPEVVEADHERDEEEGVEGRTRPVSGGPLPDQGAEVLEAEYQVEEQEGGTQHDVEQDVRVGGGRGDERRGDEAEGEEEQAEEAEDGGRSLHRLPPAYGLDRPVRQEE